MNSPISLPVVPCIILTAFLSTPVSVEAGSLDGGWDADFGNPGLNGGVASIAVKGARVFIAGLFDTVATESAANVAAWDGANWSNLAGGVDGIAYAVVPGGDSIFVGGSLSTAGGFPASHIARWDGTNWSALNVGVNDVVFALASDGQNLYAGGHFTMAGGVPASKVAKWDGTNWSALGSGIIPVNEGGIQVGAVDSLTVHGNELYVGGRFRIAGGVAATNIARWDGTNWHPLGHGLRYFNGPGAENGAVRVLRMHQGFLYAGGEFRQAGNTDANFIARWDGTNWFPVGSGAANSVQALVSNGNDLYAGGAFVSIGGVPARVVARWDGNSWSALGSGISGGAISGGLASNGSELFVGGTFTAAGGKPANNIALWHIPHALDVTREGQTATLSWPATGTNFILEAREDLSGTNWSVIATNASIVDEQCRVTSPIDSPARFFRLRRK